MREQSEGPSGPRPGEQGPRVKACNDPWEFVYVRANGDVLPCCHSLHRMGNVNEQPLDAIWNGPRYRSFRGLLASTSPLPVCRECFVRRWKPAPRPSLIQRAASALRRGEASSSVSAVPTLRLNAEHFRVGEQLTIEMGLSIDRPHRCPTLDIYLFATSAARGERTFVHMDGRFSILTPEVVPLLASHHPVEFEAVEVFYFDVPSTVTGQWTLTAFTVPAREAPGDRSKWLGDSSLIFSVAARI